MFREGDIVEIPLPDGRTAVGWILYISMHFKDVAGLIVFGIKGQMRNEDLKANPHLEVLGPLYTNVRALKPYGWTVYAHQDISESKRALTKRQVGRYVYVGDDCLGSVEEFDGGKLPLMLVMGMPVVYREIQKAFPAGHGPGSVDTVLNLGREPGSGDTK
jgi:hypothetical protein